MERVIFDFEGRYEAPEVITEWTALTRFYFAEEDKYRKEVDEAIEEILSTNLVPKNLSAPVRFYLCNRIECACDFLGMIQPPLAERSPINEVPGNWTIQDTARWLLKDLWTRRFDHWLKLSAIGSMGPFAFYGLEAADPNVVA